VKLLETVIPDTFEAGITKMYFTCFGAKIDKNKINTIIILFLRVYAIINSIPAMQSLKNLQQEKPLFKLGFKII
jgi:hypothetical protein